MNVFDLVEENERDPLYKELERTNGIRHYGLLQSIISTSLTIKYNAICHGIIKAINYHAIACLHKGAGEYRNTEVRVNGFTPPSHELVDGLMDTFVDQINDSWESEDAISLATYALWQLNAIHPFVNGNGRTARALCYYILCCKFETLFGGTTIFPELMRVKYRPDYIKAIKEADKTEDITSLARLVEQVVGESI